MDVTNPPRLLTHLFPEGQLFPALAESLTLTRTQLHGQIVEAWQTVQEEFCRLPAYALHEGGRTIYPWIPNGAVAPCRHFESIVEENDELRIGVQIVDEAGVFTFFKDHTGILKYSTKNDAKLAAWNKALEHLYLQLFIWECATHLVWATAITEMLLRCLQGNIAAFEGESPEVILEPEEGPYCATSMLPAWEDKDLTHLLETTHNATFGSAKCDSQIDIATRTWLEKVSVQELTALGLTTDDAITLSDEVFRKRRSTGLNLTPTIHHDSFGLKFQWAIKVKDLSYATKSKLIHLPMPCVLAIANQSEDTKVAITRILIRELMSEVKSLLFTFSFS